MNLTRQVNGGDGETRMVGEDVSGQNLSGTLVERVSLTGCVLRGTNLEGAVFNHVCIEDCDFTGALLSTLEASDIHARKTRFDEAVLERASLVRSSLVSNSMKRIRAAGMSAEDVEMSGCDFDGADLSFAYFSNADLAGCNLRNTNLTGTTFSRVNLTGAFLKGATFNGTEMCDVSLGATRERFVAALRDVGRLCGGAFSYPVVAALAGEVFRADYDPETGEITCGGDELEGIRLALDGMGLSVRVERRDTAQAAAGALDELLEAGCFVLTRFTFDVPGLEGNALEEDYWGVVHARRGSVVEVSTVFADRARVGAQALFADLKPAKSGAHVLFGIPRDAGVAARESVVKRALDVAGSQGLGAYEKMVEMLDSQPDSEDFSRGLVCSGGLEKLRACRGLVVEFLDEAIAVTNGRCVSLLDEARQRYLSAKSGLTHAVELVPWYVGAPGEKDRAVAAKAVAGRKSLLVELLRQTLSDEREGLRLVRLAAGAC